MAKFRGKIRRNDLEGGHWQLVAENGSEYVLDVETGDAALVDGAQVEIDGTIEKTDLSFAMTGPTLRVKSIRRG
jgi:hypothetical protein